MPNHSIMQAASMKLALKNAHLEPAQPCLITLTEFDSFSDGEAMTHM